jgi:hypothetical protein
VARVVPNPRAERFIALVREKESQPVKKKLLSALLAGAAVVTLAACDPAATPQGQIETIFGPAAGQAVAVARCESGLNPAAVSPGGGNHGLFQINSVHKASFTAVTGQPWAAVRDAHWNVVFAKWLYDQQGWRPWACSRVL